MEKRGASKEHTCARPKSVNIPFRIRKLYKKLLGLMSLEGKTKSEEELDY